MSNIIQQIPADDIEAFFDLASTIGAYIIFPANRIDKKPTINGIRGMHQMVRDRFDLTLECIRRWYIHEESPLSEHIERYRDFFLLFDDFKGYVSFFLLEDLVCEDFGSIYFWLPFAGFGETPPLPADVREYRQYMKNIFKFAKARSKRMENWRRS